jgi:hypothetical protein
MNIKRKAIVAATACLMATGFSQAADEATAEA